jgi:histidyl-tRNA synthetase
MKIQSLRGMRDIHSIEASKLTYIESKILKHTKQYQNIKMPILEPTELFARSIGLETDIVSKEMYTFLDRKNNSITLRPEGTASCVRMALQNGLIQRQEQKFCYYGPMFRYERPQKGRYRQFMQLGIEFFNYETIDAEIEMLLWANNFLKELNINFSLEINCLGSLDDRQKYSKALVTYFSQEDLDDDSKKRLSTNPMRILDSKNPGMQDIINKAPLMKDFVSSDSKSKFEALLQALEKLDIAYKINPKLVRGLDYYNDSVFEWVASDGLGSQNAIGGGGRYDGLVEILGGKATPAVGCAFGIDRILNLISIPDDKCENVILSDNLRRLEAFEFSKTFAPGTFSIYIGNGKIDKQFKFADSVNANKVFHFSDELKEGTVKFKLKDDTSWQVRYTKLNQ